MGSVLVACCEGQERERTEEEIHIITVGGGNKTSNNNGTMQDHVKRNPGLQLGNAKMLERIREKNGLENSTGEEMKLVEAQRRNGRDAQNRSDNDKQYDNTTDISIYREDTPMVASM